LALDTETSADPQVGDSEDPEDRASGSRLRTRPSGTVWVVLSLIVSAGAVVRLTGWTGGGLFFDDAWTALPARVPLGTALHMWLSAPGYTFVQRAWSLLWPDNLHWVTALPLLMGVAAPVVAFGLGRVLRFPDWLALVMAGFVAAEPVAIQYSVAVKPFELDLVAGMVLLGLTEAARRHRSTRSLVVLAIVSVLAVFFDVALVSVVVGSWAALALIALLDNRARSATLLGAGATGLAVLPLVLSVHVPPFDSTLFREFGTLVGPPYTLNHLFTVFTRTGAGFAHGVLDTPTPFAYATSPRLSDFVNAVTLAEVVLLVALALPALLACLRRRPGDPALRDLASVFVVAVAIVAYLAGKYPIGDGRTDLVLLPAVLVLLASGLERLATLLRRKTSPRAATRLGVVAALLVALGATSLAWDQRAWYPTQDLKALDRQVVRQMQPADVVVVSFRNSFTWAYDQLSPFRTHFSATSDLSYGIGFWVTLDAPRVLTQESPWATFGSSSILVTGPSTSEIPGLSSLPSTDRRLWLVGTTMLNFSPSTVHPTGESAQAPLPYSGQTVLSSNGWHATSTTLTAPGVFATLYVRSP
jgi:hypothetical protein